MVDVLSVGKYIGQEGVIYIPRQSIRIPREVKEFPNYGKGRCVYCGKNLPPGRRKYCSDSHRRKYFLETYPYFVVHWSQFRNAIIERDHNRCWSCGVTDSCEVYLEVHHIIPLHKGGAEFDPENCITLCEKCHRKKHRKRFLEPSLHSKMKPLDKFVEATT